MGWLFGYHTRKELIEHLIFGNGVKTLRHCLKGNNLWAVHEATFVAGPNVGETVRFVVLYMLRGGDKETHRWGYKDVDGDSGPNYCNCPLSYLDGLSEATSHGVEWRERVRRYWATRNRKIETGTRLQYFDSTFVVLDNLGPRGYRVQGGEFNCIYRLSKDQAARSEVLTEIKEK